MVQDGGTPGPGAQGTRKVATPWLVALVAHPVSAVETTHANRRAYLRLIPRTLRALRGVDGTISSIFQTLKEQTGTLGWSGICKCRSRELEHVSRGATALKGGPSYRSYFLAIVYRRWPLGSLERLH